MPRVLLVVGILAAFTALAWLLWRPTVEQAPVSGSALPTPESTVQSPFAGPSPAPPQLVNEVVKPPANAAVVQPAADHQAPLMITIKQRTNRQQTGTRYAKLDYRGQPLPEDADSWHCARDVESGLIWEVKRFDGGVRDNDHTYSWYDPNAGESGREDGGECLFSSCDSRGYIAEINSLELCGRNDWRLPTFAELDTLLDRDYYDPVINQRIFIHTRPYRYMTATTLKRNPQLMMYVDFFNGTSFGGRKVLDYHIRLVSVP